MMYLASMFQKYCSPTSWYWSDCEDRPKYPTNITLASYKNKLVTNIRLTDYAYIPVAGPDIIQYTSAKAGWQNMLSCSAIFDDKNKLKIHELLGSTSTSLNNGVLYHGLEDVRLVVWNDILYGIGFRPDIIPNRVIPQLIEFDDGYEIVRSWFLDTGALMEKNWQPIPDKPFCFVYDPTIPTIVELDMENLKSTTDPNDTESINRIEPPKFSGQLSGSSQLIRLSNGNYLSICHTSHRFPGNNGYMHWVYNHYFVLYDSDMKMIGVSQPWRFTGDRLEFCCGMCEHEGHICISFSVYDGMTHIMKVPTLEFEMFLADFTNDPGRFNMGPADSYLKECYYTPGAIQGLDRIIYQMTLEQNGELIDPNDIIEVVQEYKSMIQHNKGLILYMMRRHPDNKELIKYFKTLC